MEKRDNIDKTFDKIMASGFNVNTAPLQNKVVVMITTAQGIIDNGGFDYFFESEFEDNPDMQDFVLVYKEIGAIESAVAIEKALKINASGISPIYDALNEVMFRESDSNFKKLSEYIHREFELQDV